MIHVTDRQNYTIILIMRNILHALRRIKSHPKVLLPEENAGALGCCWVWFPPKMDWVGEPNPWLWLCARLPNVMVFWVARLSNVDDCCPADPKAAEKELNARKYTKVLRSFNYQAKTGFWNTVI